MPIDEATSIAFQLAEVLEHAEQASVRADELDHLLFDAPQLPELIPSLGTVVIATSLDATVKDTAWAPAFVSEHREGKLAEWVEEGIRVGQSEFDLEFPTIVTGPIDAYTTLLSRGKSVGVRGEPAGTLGTWVDHADDTFGVTAGHVLGEDYSPSDPVFQPALVDDANGATRIGEVRGASEYKRSGNRHDLALIEVHDADSDAETLEPRGDEEFAGLDVAKRGRTTSRSEGRVTRVGARRIPIRIHGRRRRFDGLFAVERPDGEPFSDFGDSGSIVRDIADESGIGMLIAGSKTGGTSGGHLTWAFPSREIQAAIATIVKDA